MKPLRIILYVVLIALAAYLWRSTRFRSSPVFPEVAEPSAAVLQSLEVAEPTLVPVVPALESRPIAPIVAEIEPERPVQSLEERGDAMLFEADALKGTPFDQAIVMPFE